MAIVVIATSGCHLIFPFHPSPADSSVDAGPDAVANDGTSLVEASTDTQRSDKGKTDGGSDTLVADDAKHDGLKKDGPKLDGKKPDGPKPDVLKADTLKADGPKPDSKNPCGSITCLNGGTCKTGDAGTAYCSCKTGYAGTTCNACDTGYCGYASGACQLKPVINKVELLCTSPAPKECQTNESYTLKTYFSNSADTFSAQVVWYLGCGLYSNDLGTWVNNNPVTTSPHSATYNTPTKTLTYPGTAKFEVTLSVSGKSDCTTTDTSLSKPIY